MKNNVNINNITKSDELIEFEQKLKKSYDKAKDLYNELELIKNQYRGNIDVSCMLTHYHNMRTMTILPIFKTMTLTLEKTKTISNNGTPTGYAADIENTNQQDMTDNNEQTLENTIIQEEQQGYAGDSLEAAAEYKRKAVEEAKKKAEQAHKNTSNPINQNNKKWIMPCKGKITGYYGEKRSDHIHNGIDIVTSIGTPIKAIADGTVCAVGKASGYGQWVAINHGKINGVIVTSEYGHISRWTVKLNQRVKQGDVIAYVGNVGRSSAPHCHLTIREGAFQSKKAVNPYKYIDKNSY